MLMVATPKNNGINAPTIAMGTLIMMTSGSRKLSNCAASTRKMMTSAKPKVIASWLPSCTYWRESAR
jgi:hypothetical protein